MIIPRARAPSSVLSASSSVFSCPLIKHCAPPHVYPHSDPATQRAAIHPLEHGISFSLTRSGTLVAVQIRLYLYLTSTSISELSTFVDLLGSTATSADELESAYQNIALTVSGHIVHLSRHHSPASAHDNPRPQPQPRPSDFGVLHPLPTTSALDLHRFLPWLYVTIVLGVSSSSRPSLPMNPPVYPLPALSSASGV
jgi:hypothetical protein